MREAAIVGYVQGPQRRYAGAANESELIMPVVGEVMRQTGVTMQDIDFTCSGSCDYLQGAAFAFVEGLSALATVPPIKESHVEMDAAWALYEALLKIWTGDADVCLVYGFGKSSPGELRSVLTLQLDPYYHVPLWPDSVSMAALQARALLDSGAASERDLAEVVARSRVNALANPNAQLKGRPTVEQLLAEPAFVSPLRRHDCAPITDGASAMIVASGDAARRLCARPAWIRGIDHRMETGILGARDLTRSPSARLAAERAGVARGRVDLVELHAPFSHQEIILRRELGLANEVPVNLSGGALAANAMMVAGFDRIGYVAGCILEGKADRGVAHATSGHCLQQNLVAVLEA
ncbi:MAG: 3-ketoacyl-CoA thiolase [Pseudomonadales bacterium]|nr:3-ketoacyl-CoA thiolase [Pseudomonadales bacterium]